MWKDDNDKIEELYLNLKEIKKFPVICPICKKMMHIYICMFMMIKQGEEVCGFGVVNVMHFLIA